jgi:hypothetical protein
VQLHVEITVEFRGGAREAMRHSVRKRRAVFAKDREKVRMRISLMQKDWLARLCGEFKLAVKRFALRIMRGEVAVIVKAALTDCDDFGSLRKYSKNTGGLGGPFLRNMRMQASGGKQPTRMRLREPHRRLCANNTRPRNDHLHDARGRCAREHGITVRIETVMRKVKADVNQGDSCGGRDDGVVLRCGIFWHA